MKEVSDPDFFASRSVSQIVTECLLLIIRHTAAVPQTFDEDDLTRPVPISTYNPTDVIPDTAENEAPLAHGTQPFNGTAAPSSNDLPQVSLQHMVNASVVLKARTPVEFVDSVPAWPYSLFTSTSPRTHTGGTAYASAAASPKSTLR